MATGATSRVFGIPTFQRQVPPWPSAAESSGRSSGGCQAGDFGGWRKPKTTYRPGRASVALNTRYPCDTPCLCHVPNPLAFYSKKLL